MTDKMKMIIGKIRFVFSLVFMTGVVFAIVLGSWWMCYTIGYDAGQEIGKKKGRDETLELFEISQGAYWEKRLEFLTENENWNELEKLAEE